MTKDEQTFSIPKQIALAREQNRIQVGEARRLHALAGSDVSRGRKGAYRRAARRFDKAARQSSEEVIRLMRQNRKTAR